MASARPLNSRVAPKVISRFLKMNTHWSPTMTNAAMNAAMIRGPAIEPLPCLGGFPNGRPSSRNNSTPRYIEPIAKLYAQNSEASPTPQYHKQMGNMHIGSALMGIHNAQKIPRTKDR